MSIFIDKLTDFYKPMPYGPGFVRTLTPLIEALNPEAQENAAQGLIRSRKAKGWPSLSECEAALRRAAEAPAPILGGSGREWKSSDQMRADRIAETQARITAFKLCRCNLGREAHEGRWLNALLDFCTDHGRLPDAREQRKLQDLAVRNDEAAIRAGRTSPALIEMREAMHARAYRDVFEFEASNAA
jgi:hypothetical protein